ncbi:MAG: bifunctional biotin--[acetyl-CoA-carboxylase] ligase/biotin operon repressor BirA [Chromatiales bacterium]|jgi:BirA family biotin operon repressor/biotin-[acetyl-CoA-carboxylase] ligase
MDIRDRLLRALADGRFRSGEALAQELGITRAAVWKQIKRLGRELDLEIDAVSGRGYRLVQPLELLESARIEAHLPPLIRSRLQCLHIHPSIESTNSWLMQEATRAAPSGTVCLAEHQTAGKGRHGRQWISPFGRNIYLSMLWRFECSPVELSGMSLAAGIGVLRTLRLFDCQEAGLKWPNDILWRGKKLAGLLLEVAGEAAGPAYLVIGVGLNLRLDAAGAHIDQPWTDLASIPDVRTHSRNELVARLLENLLQIITEYEQTGLAGFIEEWDRYDLLKGSQVVVRNASNSYQGEHLGIDSSGCLKLKVDDEVRIFWAGEVSLRYSSDE